MNNTQKPYYTDPKLVSEIKMNYINRVKASDRIKVRNTDDAYHILKPFYDDVMELTERFVVIYLNRAHDVLCVDILSDGDDTATIVSSKQVMIRALKLYASSIILSHNHPSGNLKASSQDHLITQKIKDAGKFMDITLIDHLIITRDDYESILY